MSSGSQPRSAADRHRGAMAVLAVIVLVVGGLTAAALYFREVIEGPISLILLGGWIFFAGGIWFWFDLTSNALGSFSGADE